MHYCMLDKILQFYTTLISIGGMCCETKLLACNTECVRKSCRQSVKLSRVCCFSTFEKLYKVLEKSHFN